MARIPYKKSPALVVGAALVALLLHSGVSPETAKQTAQQAINTVAKYEGYVPQAYRDPAGIWTKCYGDTTNVTPGESYTAEECAASLNAHLVETSEPVFRCLPDLAKQHPMVIVAFLDMAYNTGPTAFCKSSIAQHARDGDWTAACKRMAEIYKTGRGGIPLQGLVIRRTDESEMCLQGVMEGRK